MYLPANLRSYCLSLIANPLFQQLAPFVVLFVVPFIVLYAAQTVKRSRLFWSAAMLLGNFGLSFGASMPWNWGGAAHASGSGGHERKKKKHPRTRVEQMAAMHGDASSSREGYSLHTPLQPALNVCADSDRDQGIDDGYYPGLVNISGTYCFMNSTLQVRSRSPVLSMPNRANYTGNGILVVHAATHRRYPRARRSSRRAITHRRRTARITTG